MRKLLIGMAAGAMLPLSAQATVYDDLADFSFSGFSQGLGSCSFAGGCGSVPLDRTGLEKAFDGGTAAGQFHTLGTFGFATFGVAAGEGIFDVVTLETTFGGGGDSWPEKVGLFLSNQLNDGSIATWSADLAADLGALANAVTYAGGDGADRAAVDGSDLAALLRARLLADGVLAGIFTNDADESFNIDTAAGVSIVGGDLGNGPRFDVDIDTAVFGNYRYLTLVDLTMSDDPEFWLRTPGDGWDLAELAVEAARVPEPATATLLGLGVLGLALRRRRP